MTTATKTEYDVVLRRPHPKQTPIRASEAKRRIIRAGRRGGKTIIAAVIALDDFLAGRRVLYATPTSEQIDAFWYEVKRALAEPLAADIYYKNETEHLIELRGTKTRIRAKTAWNADMLRGDYADLLIFDEYQLMNESAWDEVGSPMLLDNDGDAIFIYTPPSLRSRSVSKARDPRHAAKMFKRAQEDTSGRWAAFHFSSHDNPHISQDALANITEDMTNLAYRQEIMAEDVDDIPGALWNRELIEATRVTEHPDLVRVVVGVDPPGGATECGIVTAGVAMVGEQLHGYIVEDRSLQASPNEWASEVLSAYNHNQADRVVGEANYGGDMVENTIRQAAKSRNQYVAYQSVHASRGKAVRAEPVVAMYEQGRIHLVGAFPYLEDEMCLDGDTIITTGRGLVPIRYVGLGDMVLTRQGWNSVTFAGITGLAERMVEIHTLGGRHLLTTVRHPVYTQSRGFVRADSLEPGDALETDTWPTSQKQPIVMANRSSGRTSVGSSTTAATTWTGKVLSCIARYGRYITVLFHRTARSITGMVTASTSILPTWNWQLANSMSDTIPGTDGLNLSVSEYQHSSRNGGSIRKNTRLSVLDVASNSKVPECGQCSVLASADADTIVSIEVIDRSVPVYNLMVDDVHEFYANGVLVHNCMWIPGETKESPNRVDALVWAVTELMLSEPEERVTMVYEDRVSISPF